MSSYLGQKSFIFEHAIGDKVMVDGDGAIPFIVTSIQVFPDGLVYKLSWFDEGGGPRDQVFDEFRVSARK